MPRRLPDEIKNSVVNTDFTIYTENETPPNGSLVVLRNPTTGELEAAQIDNLPGVVLPLLPDHATNHTDGTDDIQDATAGQKGLMTAAYATKLDGIEAGATADQTGAEIKAAYEAEADTNAFTDAEQAKLAGITAGADMLKSVYDINDDGIIDHAEHAHKAIVDVRKGSPGTILKGQPVYIVDFNPSGFIEVELASNTTRPAFGVANEDITNAALGEVVTFGQVSDFDTSSLNVDDDLYLADTPGDWSTTPPTTEAKNIQKVAVVLRSHGSFGSITVFGAGRSNAVSNLDSGAFFLGNVSNQAEATDFDTEVSANTDVSANTTHRSSDGSDHTFIDQDVTSGSSPTLTGTNFTGLPDGGLLSGATVISAGAGDSGKLVKLDANGHVDATTINDSDINLDNITEGVTNLFFTSADNTKLDGIEALADVTDSTNVDAAGAVMNSDTSTAAMSFVIDEDLFTSNSDTKVPTQQSVKAYVDTKVASPVYYRGGYDANTNTPDLDTSPSGVLIGDMYTVTVAGTFFTTGVEVGDVLISEKNDPTLESDWTIANRNLDDASIKVAYENNADTNAFTDADESKLDGIEALAEVNNISDVDATDLTDLGDTTLHYHSSDRARANHTGTQTASTISDFDTEVSNNTDVAANTTHRTSDGSDHTFIDQSVVSGAAPTFTGTNFTGIPDGGLLSGATVVSAGAGDSGKLVKLDAAGHVDATAINDADINLDNVTEGATNLFFTSADNTKLDGIEALAEVNNISDLDATDLTDAGESALHYHDSDRARANHTGTQTASTISDFDTEVGNHVDVAANTTHRTSDGSDHTFIDQSVVSGAAPTFTGTNFTGIPDGSFVSGATVVSAGAGDSGKLVKLDAAGHVDATAINDADINLDNVTEGVTNLFFTSSDNTKLDGIEALADVTDEANVTAALPIVDETSIVYKTGDASANMRIDANAITAATTRVLTMPDQDIDLTPGTGSFATEAEGNLAATALQDVVSDTTPQLGGQLDVNGNAFGDGTNELLTFVEDGSAINHIEIENEAAGSGPILRSTGDDANVELNIDTKGTADINILDNLDVTGNITLTGTVDGRDLTTDGTKLDGIEALADVTDATNVAAAGAVMDSDISAAEGFLRKTGAGAYEAIKSNLSASVAPVAGDDSGDGYAVGSIWIDTTNDKQYICVDSTAAAAVWQETTQNPNLESLDTYYDMTTATEINYNNGNNQEKTASSGDITFTLANFTAGDWCYLRIIASGADRTFTFPSGIIASTPDGDILVASGYERTLYILKRDASDTELEIGEQKKAIPA